MGRLQTCIRKLDIFRQIDEAYLSTATAYGGTLSLLAFAMVAILFSLELSSYISSSTSANVLLDVNQDESLLIKFNITMLALPCKFVAIDVYDRFGWNRQRISSDVVMKRIHFSKGREITGAEIPKDRGRGHEFIAKDFEKQEIEVDEEGHHALDLRGDDVFNRELLQHEYTLVNFYTPWCHWCRALAPTYEAAAVEFDKRKIDAK